jgi:hypothetical protein
VKEAMATRGPWAKEKLFFQGCSECLRLQVCSVEC